MGDFVSDDGLLIFSDDASGDELTFSDGFGSNFRGRPRLGLEASGAPSLVYAGFTSPQALVSVLSTPLGVSPTLITKVLLDGLDKISKGPCQLV